MDRFEQLYTLLKTLKIPVAYDHFDSNKGVEPPFIAYRENPQDTFKADNKTTYRNYNFEIELITTKKDVSLQTSIETLLTNNNIPFDTSNEVWDDDEKIYHYFYEI